MEIKRRVLVFGLSPMLNALTVSLRSSPLLTVIEHRGCMDIPTFASFHPDVILVDAEQATAELFKEFLSSKALSQAILISIDPQTYQITVLSSPYCHRPLERIARVIEILTIYLPKPYIDKENNPKEWEVKRSPPK